VSRIVRYNLMLPIPLALAITGTASAQAIADRVNAIRDGTVRMSFAARPGVCGDGMGSVWIRDARHDVDARRACIAGPIRVAVGRDNGVTVSVRTRVGGAWTASRSEIDLGSVSAEDAARYLLRLSRELAGRNADEAMSGAVFADAGDISPELARLVRDRDVGVETRKQALFWFGQGDAPTKDLVRMYDSLDARSLREHFTFVVSQRRDDEAVDKLIDIARADRDPQIRKQAMFWLGQNKDPRAIKFFHDVLLR
jgi:hypothetical protein